MVRIAAVKAVGQRFSLALFLIAAVGLIAFGRIDPATVSLVQARVTDAAAPILDAFAQPTRTASAIVAEVDMLTALREENARLLAENATLQQFREAAYRLEAENLTLQMLLNYRPPEPHNLITGRVMADNSGAFVRSLALAIGSENGVRDGLAVLGGSGLIGRTVQTGDRSSRVLLITDLNARIPVTVEGSRHRAVMAGDNSPRPRLVHLPPDAELLPGERVVTSGHGGMFPPGLPVGVIVRDGPDGAIRVQPLEDLSRIEYARVVDFSPWVAEAAVGSRFDATTAFSLPRRTVTGRGLAGDGAIGSAVP